MRYINQLACDYDVLYGFLFVGIFDTINENQIIFTKMWNDEVKLIEEDDTELVCPFCGQVQSDAWELDSDEDMTECDFCEKEFRYCRQIKYTYISRKVKKGSY